MRTDQIADYMFVRWLIQFSEKPTLVFVSGM